MGRQEKWIRIRIRLVGFVFLLAFCLVTVRAFTLQVLHQDDWEKRAERQHQKVIPLIPQRGTVYDCNGEELALSLEVDSVFLEPQKVTDPVATARALSSALSLPFNQVKSKASSGKSFLWLKRQISPRESEQVKALALDGVGFIKEHRRYYPNSEIGAQILGFTGLDPEGLEGLELRYDSQLLGQGGLLVTERDALGRGLGSSDPMIQTGRRGNDLHLTIDRTLQYVAEKELAAGVEKARAKAGTVIVVEPSTGKILAMASQPDFNPNAIFNFNPSQWRNRAICDTFEPGSTFKVFLMAGALEENLVRPEQKIYCEKGAYRVGGRVIHDHHPYETLSVAEILQRSSNIGTAKIAKIMERDKFYRYITGFGFGGRTGIDLPGEATGLVRKPSQWFEVDLAAISFGQGISVTPMQLAMATAAIANGGNLMAPYLVEKVTNTFGDVVEEHKPKEVRRVISRETAARMRGIMATVAEEGGTGTLASVPGFRVGGKTGTAQKVDPVTGGYSPDKRVSSFVGFAPVEDPKLLVLVLIDEPKGEKYGGLIAAPIFSRITEQGLRYLKVAPTLPIPVKEEPKQTLAKSDKKADEQTDGGGDGDVAAAEEETEDNSPRMPNFVGMSFRQVLETMTQSGVNVKLKGSGRVIEQFPPPGKAIQYGTETWVQLAPPT